MSSFVDERRRRKVSFEKTRFDGALKNINMHDDDDGEEVESVVWVWELERAHIISLIGEETNNMILHSSMPPRASSYLLPHLN